MKILHISTGFPISFQGGITNYVRSLAESQVKNGENVWVMGGIDKTQHTFKYYEYYSKLIEPFSFRYAKDISSLNNISKFLEKEKFDIIHIHMMLDIDLDLFKILKQYKYIISLHDYFYLCPRITMVDTNNLVCNKYEANKCNHCISKFDLCKYTRALNNRLDQYLNFRISIKQNVTKQRFAKLKALLEGATYLLPVSHRVKEIYTNSDIKNNYEVLHIGNISADKFENRIYDINSIANRKINIAMLGSLSYLKGGDLLLNIAQKINKDKYSIHFYGRSSVYKNKLKKYNIIDHGTYSQKNLSKILSNIDLGFVLSIWEDNGPQVVMEFLNNHIPVIGTKMGGIPDFVDNKNGYLFNPYNEKEFELLIDYLNNLTKEDIITMKNNIKPTTTTQEHYIALMNIYNKVLNGDDTVEK